MSLEVTQHNPGSIDVLPPARPIQSNALAQLRDHAEAMATAKQLATVMCATQMVPKIYRDKPDDGAAAILYGAEIGLNPIQSMQNVFPVHGMPSLYSRTMVALIKRHGPKVQTIESSDEKVTVWGQAPDGTEETSTWTIERAEKAGYVPEIDEQTGKFKVNQYGKLIGNEKYLKDPKAMLYAKAAAEVCRHLAPDVLLGIAYSYEDLESESDFDEAPRRVRNETARVDVDNLRARLGVATRPAVESAVIDNEPAQVDEEDQKPEPEQVADPDPQPEPEPPKTTTKATTTKPTKSNWEQLNALFEEANLQKDNTAGRIIIVNRIINRDAPVTSANQLTRDEVATLLEVLAGLKDQGILLEQVETMLTEEAQSQEAGQ